MVPIPIITSLAKIITISFPYKLIIMLLSKTFPMSHGHIFKINITHIRIINHKLIHISVNSPNSPPNIKLSSLSPNSNHTMIINTVPLQPIQPIFKFIGHPIHPLIHNA
jgi:hypothetical protein